MTEEELLFISANKQKLVEAKKTLSQLDVSVKCVEYHYKELLEDDLLFITLDKATLAYNTLEKPLIVMDTGFYIKNYPGQEDFPGTFIKRDLLDSIGIAGLLENMKDVEDRSCTLKECLIYYDGNVLKHFVGERRGTLAYFDHGPKEESHWTAIWGIFQPLYSDKTLIEMSEKERRCKTDHHTDALENFAIWYKRSREKEEGGKVYHK